MTDAPVERYRVCYSHPDGGEATLITHPEGEFVAYSDYAALSVPAAAVVGEPVGMGVFRNGEMIGFVGIGDEFKLPEDTDERRPIYDDPSATDGWQSIETAPKDAVILLYGRIDPNIEFDRLVWKNPSVFSGCWDTIDDAWVPSGGTWEGPFMQVTHWRPLPTPPALGGASHE